MHVLLTILEQSYRVPPLSTVFNILEAHVKPPPRQVADQHEAVPLGHGGLPHPLRAGAGLRNPNIWITIWVDLG